MNETQNSISIIFIFRMDKRTQRPNTKLWTKKNVKNDTFEDQKRVKNANQEQSLEDVYSTKNLDHADVSIDFSKCMGQKSNFFTNLE